MKTGKDKKNIAEAARKLALRSRRRKWILGTCIVLGAGLGFCYWLFIGKCDEIGCFYNTNPTAHILGFAFGAWMIPAVFMGTDIKKKKK